MTSERRKKLTEVLQHRQADITVVFENVEDPHNIAAVLRTCESAGIQDVYVLNYISSSHPKLGKNLGAKSSSSAWKWLTIYYYDDLENCVHNIKEKGYKLMATSLSAEAADLYEVDFTQKLALVFGNEHYGVSDELLRLCDGNFIIPQVGIIRSLNISVACAISIYEAFRQKRLAGHYEKTNLPTEKLNTLKTEWGLDEE
jgi:tRNA (guanosine-2'-O-)-methyltransferase